MYVDSAAWLWVAVMLSVVLVGGALSTPTASVTKRRGLGSRPAEWLTRAGSHTQTTRSHPTPHSQSAPAHDTDDIEAILRKHGIQ